MSSRSQRTSSFYGEFFSQTAPNVSGIIWTLLYFALITTSLLVFDLKLNRTRRKPWHWCGIDQRYSDVQVRFVRVCNKFGRVSLGCRAFTKRISYGVFNLFMEQFQVVSSSYWKFQIVACNFIQFYWFFLVTIDLWLSNDDLHKLIFNEPPVNWILQSVPWRHHVHTELLGCVCFAGLAGTGLPLVSVQRLVNNFKRSGYVIMKLQSELYQSS